MFHVPNQYRVRRGAAASDDSYGNNGAFVIPPIVGSRHMCVIASDGLWWEHVSVHIDEGRAKTRVPNWDEMCYIKSLFWDDDDVVMQLHPAKSEYVNNFKTCLHLWRPVGKSIPTPPAILVGYKELGVIPIEH